MPECSSMGAAWACLRKRLRARCRRWMFTAVTSPVSRWRGRLSHGHLSLDTAGLAGSAAGCIARGQIEAAADDGNAWRTLPAPPRAVVYIPHAGESRQSQQASPGFSGASVGNLPLPVLAG